MNVEPTDMVAVNGRITRLGELRLSDFWHGFAFGAGFFETILIRSGKPMFLEAHLERLCTSLEQHRDSVRSPPSDVLSAEAVARTLSQCLEQGAELGTHFDGAVKLLASDGQLVLSFRRLFKTATATATASDEMEILGTDTVTYRRGDATLNHKSTSYLRQYRFIGEPILFVNERQEACETPIGNLFFLDENRIVTPPLAAPCLPGIIRGILLRMKTYAGFSIVEADMPLARLGRVTGCVMTNSLQLARPVRMLLGHPMNRSVELARLFNEQLTTQDVASPHLARGRGAG